MPFGEAPPTNPVTSLQPTPAAQVTPYHPEPPTVSAGEPKFIGLDFLKRERCIGSDESEKSVVREQFFPNPGWPRCRQECSATLFEFEAVERRAVMAGFDGGDITSNAGALLLGQVDRGLGLIRRFAGCFTDRRDARYVEHRVETLVGQRIFVLVLGYEDLNDHVELAQRPNIRRADRQAASGAAVGL